MCAMDSRTAVRSGATVEDTGRGTARERVAALLRAEILAGRLAPGAPLRTEAVMERFGVSNSPLREAFAQLAAEGLVEVNRNRGAVVAPLTHDGAVDLVRAGTLVWCAALEWIVPRLQQPSIDDLRRTDVNFGLAVRSGDLAGAVLDGERFQLQLLEACDSPELVRTITSGRPRMQRVVRMLATLPVMSVLGAFHAAVLDAAGTAEPAPAMAAFRRVGDELVTALDRGPDVLGPGQR
jgi:DNA-binding GntR family transcriptional regulator